MLQPLDKVEELIMIMNQMDKSGISEEETRRIVLEEFLKFQKEKLDERYLKQRFQQSGDGNSVNVDLPVIIIIIFFFMLLR